MKCRKCGKTSKVLYDRDNKLLCEECKDEVLGTIQNPNGLKGGKNGN